MKHLLIIFILLTPTFVLAMDQEEKEKALRSPTKGYQQYEEARSEDRYEKSIPDWAVSLTTEINAFNQTDLRQPPPQAGTDAFYAQTPYLFGLLFGAEKFLIKDLGMLSFGGELGLYGNKGATSFNTFFPIYVYGFSGLLHYELLLMRDQFFVPSIRFGAQDLWYNYVFNGSKDIGNHLAIRYDLGLLLFLNDIDRKTAASMYQTAGVKRTYLAGYYSIARDLSAGVIDFSNSTFRIGLNFEF